MAGDGGRASDASEQRAEPLHGPHCTIGPGGVCMSAHCQWCGRPHSMWTACGCEWSERRQVAPASVLAALLAESPEATVAAIEALLMGEGAVRSAERSLVASARSCLSDAEAATFAISAACRSLLPKTPKEDRDA